MGSRVPRSGGKTLPVSLDVAGSSLPTRVTPTPSAERRVATVWRGLTGLWRVFPYRGTSTHTANGLTVDWSIRSRVFQSAALSTA